MAVIEVVVCDVCRDPSKPTDTYEIGLKGHAREVVLCEADAQPVLDLVGGHVQPKKAPQKRSTGSRTAKRPQRMRVVSLEEIEAQKGV